VKRLGLDNEGISEIVAVVDVFSGTNAIAQGLTRWQPMSSSEEAKKSYSPEARGLSTN